MCVDNTSFNEVYSENYIKIHYWSKIFYFYEVAQMCTSVLNDRKFVRNFMWKIFIKKSIRVFYWKLITNIKTWGTSDVMHTFVLVERIYDFYVLSWKCYILLWLYSSIYSHGHCHCGRLNDPASGLWSDQDQSNDLICNAAKCQTGPAFPFLWEYPYIWGLSL